MLIVETPYPVRVAAGFTRLVDATADTQDVADAVVAALRDMDVALSPIIGRQTLLALLIRSISLTDAHYRWPDMKQQAADAETCLAALRSALARRLPSETAGYGATLLATLHRLLTAAIGHSLTERLLHDVGRTSREGLL